MQFQADMLGCRIERPACMETTALGAAALAALALGWHTPESLSARPAERSSSPPCRTTSASACSPAGARPSPAPPAGKKALPAFSSGPVRL